MLKFSQIYEGVLIEINKYKAPAFQLEDFNYYGNRAVTNVIDRKLGKEDLQVLARPLVYAKTPSTPSGEKQLAGYLNLVPTDYFRLLPNVKVLFKVKTDYRGYRVGSEYLAVAVPYNAEKKGVAQGNHFLKPSWQQVYYRVMDNKLVIEAGNPAWLELERIDTEYLKNFEPYALESAGAAGTFQEASNKTSEFPRDVDQEIIVECAALFLENAQSNRFQTIKQN